MCEVFFVCQCDDFLLWFDARLSSFKVTLSVVYRQDVEFSW